MRINKKEILKRRKFSSEFKKKIVSEFESGRYSVKALSRLHSIAPTQIYNWVYKYSTTQEKGYRVVEMSESSSEKLKKLETKIKELEAIVGRKQIKIDFLEKMVDLAEQEYSIDIKKKCSTEQSSTSDQNHS